jgi:hypothetical protein
MRRRLVSNLSALAPLTAGQLCDYCKAISTYMEAIGAGGVVGSVPTSRVMTPADFPDKSAGKLYKFVSKETWERYLSQGKIQLGSARYYRAIENSLIKDTLEGFSVLALVCGEDQLLPHLDVGTNFFVFCGTRRASTAKKTMRERFGDVQVEITDTEAFADAIQRRIGATSYYVRDVVYTDVKALSTGNDFSDIADHLRAHCQSALTDDALRLINSRLFETLCEFGLLPSLFSKRVNPYSVERERRIAFKMPPDSATSFLRFDCPEILPLMKAQQP